MEGFIRVTEDVKYTKKDYEVEDDRILHEDEKKIYPYKREKIKRYDPSTDSSIIFMNIRCYILDGDMMSIAKNVYIYYENAGDMIQLLVEIFSIYVEVIGFLNPSLVILFGGYFTEKVIEPNNIIALCEYIVESPKSFLMRYMRDSMFINYEEVRRRKPLINEETLTRELIHSFEDSLQSRSALSIYYYILYIRQNSNTVREIYNILIDNLKNLDLYNQQFKNSLLNFIGSFLGDNERLRDNIALMLIGIVYFQVNCSFCDIMMNYNIEEKWKKQNMLDAGIIDEEFNDVIDVLVFYNSTDIISSKTKFLIDVDPRYIMKYERYFASLRDRESWRSIYLDIMTDESS